ncbi:MAG TPA: hypothetical protein VE961_06660 [Pyrinomonadaceae bacterium]|nr:hypothetical protein [Pyrinomonadaceae bacterium]
MMIRKHSVVIVFVLCALLALTGIAAAQDPQPSLVASASGEGKIKLGKEEFKLNAVVVKGFQDGKIEINLVTDITVFISGTWSRTNETDRTINVKITGGSTSGNLDGGGTITLTDDRKIAGLKLQLVNKITKKTITADFTGK